MTIPTRIVLSSDRGELFDDCDCEVYTAAYHDIAMSCLDHVASECVREVMREAFVGYEPFAHIKNSRILVVLAAGDVSWDGVEGTGYEALELKKGWREKLVDEAIKEIKWLQEGQSVVVAGRIDGETAHVEIRRLPYGYFRIIDSLTPEVSVVHPLKSELKIRTAILEMLMYVLTMTEHDFSIKSTPYRLYTDGTLIQKMWPSPKILRGDDIPQEVRDYLTEHNLYWEE